MFVWMNFSFELSLKNYFRNSLIYLIPMEVAALFSPDNADLYETGILATPALLKATALSFCLY